MTPEELAAAEAAAQAAAAGHRIQYVKRATTGEFEGEPYLNTVYRALTPPFTTQHYRDSEAQRYVHLDYSEVLSVASDEWTPISNMIARAEGVRDIKHFWMEQRLTKTPGFGFVSELADPSPSDTIAPTRYENVMATQAQAFKMDDEAQIIARAGGLIAVGPDEFARQMQERLNQLVRNQEYAILESAYVDTGLTRRFRGLLGNYRNADGSGAANNGWIGDNGVGVESATTLDFAGEEITKDNLEALLDRYMLQLRLLQGGGLPDTLFVSPRLLRVFKEAASSKIQITMTQDEVGRAVARNFGGIVGKFWTAFGMLNIVAHPLLLASNDSVGTGDEDPARSRMLALHLPDIRLMDYAGYGGVHVETRAKTDPTETRIIKQIYTLEVRKLLTHGVIKNFWVAAEA